MGLYKRGEIWWMSYTADGEHRCESTKSNNKRIAQKVLDLRKGDVVARRFHLPSLEPVAFETFADEFLKKTIHSVTKKRYLSSVRNLLSHFKNIQLSAISTAGVDEFKAARLESGVRTATVNRDLAVLRHMLRTALKKKFLTAHDLPEIEMLEEAKQRRVPHILTLEEEEKLLATAPDHIQMLAILILEAGLRSRLEALSLKWEQIDFARGTIQIVKSKSLAGRRSIPMSSRCRKALLEWRTRTRPQFSPFVFPNPARPNSHLVDIRVSWSATLKSAGLEYFWIYDLRHTFATRLAEAGVSRTVIAQLLGHSNPNIVQIYAKATDTGRRSAIRNLEILRDALSNVRVADEGQSALLIL
jgi:integrase